MALFPLFINLENKDVLIIGAGEVALRKIEKLLPFEPKITVVADKIKRKEILDFEKKNKIKIINRKFLFTDLDGRDLVITATDDIDLQKEIYNFCFRRKIPVNSVDNPDYCSFIFPAYIKKGDLVIGITTSGKAPALSAKLRSLIENCLPEDIEKILKELEEIRKTFPKGKERQQLLIEKLKEIFD